jgi:putative oxidoreductase
MIEILWNNIFIMSETETVSWSEKLKPFAAIFIRLAFGYHLFQYSYGDVFQGTAGSGNEEMLAKLGVPFPYFMGWLYILTEFLGSISMIIGFKIRWFAFALGINFIVALYLVHLNKTYMQSFEAIQMLAVSLFFLFNGSGKLSVDDFIQTL